MRGDEVLGTFTIGQVNEIVFQITFAKVRSILGSWLYWDGFLVTQDHKPAGYFTCFHMHLGTMHDVTKDTYGYIIRDKRLQ